MRSRSWCPGDVIRLPANNGGFRVWRVVGIFLGGTDHESVVEIVTLDREASPEGTLRMPRDLLDAACGAFVDGIE